MHPLAIVLGAACVAWALNDVFKAVLVPRAVEGEFRISVIGTRLLWRVWRAVGSAMRAGKAREDFLGAYGPLAFVVLILLWLVALITGFALVLWGLPDPMRPAGGFGDAMYFAATSVLTIGFGDVVAGSGVARFIALCAGASGLGTVAVTIAFIYQLVGSVQQRERFVVFLDGRAGAPPSGIALLETYASLGILADLDELFRESERWVAHVLDSHLAYPLLMSFRSSHKDESWVASLGALLDAAALLVTVVDGFPTGAARLILDAGMHLTHDLDGYFALPDVPVAPPDRSKRSALCARLQAAGFSVTDSPERWQSFSALRTSYGAPLAGIGERWLVSTAMLLGERTTLPGH